MASENHTFRDRQRGGPTIPLTYKYSFSALFKNIELLSSYEIMKDKSGSSKQRTVCVRRHRVIR